MSLFSILCFVSVPNVTCAYSCMIQINDDDDAADDGDFDDDDTCKCS